MRLAELEGYNVKENVFRKQTVLDTGWAPTVAVPRFTINDDEYAAWVQDIYNDCRREADENGVQMYFYPRHNREKQTLRSIHFGDEPTLGDVFWGYVGAFPTDRRDLLSDRDEIRVMFAYRSEEDRYHAFYDDIKETIDTIDDRYPELATVCTYPEDG